MPELLLELFSEEIPARMQSQAARDLARLFRERVSAAGLAAEGLRTFAGPRRLTLLCELPARTADQSEQIKGPKASAPPQALEGFLRKTGLSREQLTERNGVLIAVVERPGRATPEIVAEAVEAVVRGFPWPKSMRWGDGTLRWVRPLKRILCLFDGAVVPLAIEGVTSGDATEGHRFMGTGRPLKVRGFDDYQRQLADNFVVLDVEERKARILERGRALCGEAGLALVEDTLLLEEVAGLSEWPMPILGEMDPAFLDLPAEVIRTSMRTHQKYFAVAESGLRSDGMRDAAEGDAVRSDGTRSEAVRLAPRFLTVANIEPSDGGAAVAAGNARVLSARLNDARFFWDEDRRDGAIAGWLEKLNGATFHAKLGTMAERVERIAALAREIAPQVGADADLAELAARLCKADLASGMVGEFPELQGVMGGYYVRALDASPLPAPAVGDWAAVRDEVADAVRDHYRPQGPGDAVPTVPLTVAVALADKLDTLVGFFAIDEKPTGSKDPYALRRAALGVIRVLQASNLRWQLTASLQKHQEFVRRQRLLRVREDREVRADRLAAEMELRQPIPVQVTASYVATIRHGKMAEAEIWDLLAFFADRLKVLLRDQGQRHDLVDAVFALGDDDLVRITARVRALEAFLSTEDGANLLAGYRRAANILKAEAKKHPGEVYDGAVEPERLSAAEERALAEALERVGAEVGPRLEAEDFEGAMSALARLRGPVDAFFDRVLVNDADPAVRLNRLRLLGRVQAEMGRVADFSAIVG